MHTVQRKHIDFKIKRSSIFLVNKKSELEPCLATSLEIGTQFSLKNCPILIVSLKIRWYQPCPGTTSDLTPVSHLILRVSVPPVSVSLGRTIRLIPGTPRFRPGGGAGGWGRVCTVARPFVVSPVTVPVIGSMRQFVWVVRTNRLVRT